MKIRVHIILLLATTAAAAPALAQSPPPGPDRGDFLVASRELDDPNFARSVVLLLDAGPDGAAGVVVNRPTLTRVASAFPGIAAISTRDDSLFWGGPVEPRAAVILVRQDEAPPGSVRVVDGVHALRTRAGIEEALRRGPPEAALRVFTGYAGWTAGQLEAEIARGGWHLRPADAGRIFAEEVQSLWETLVRIARSPVA